MSELGQLVEEMDQKQARLDELLQAREWDDESEPQMTVTTQGQDNEIAATGMDGTV